jgi:hypothetical protein
MSHPRLKVTPELIAHHKRAAESLRRQAFRDAFALLWTRAVQLPKRTAAIFDSVHQLLGKNDLWLANRRTPRPK